MALGLEELKILIMKKKSDKYKLKASPFLTVPPLGKPLSPQREKLHGRVLPETLSPKSRSGTLILYYVLKVSIASHYGASLSCLSHFLPKEELDFTCFPFRHDTLCAQIT